MEEIRVRVGSFKKEDWMFRRKQEMHLGQREKTRGLDSSYGLASTNRVKSNVLDTNAMTTERIARTPGMITETFSYCVVKNIFWPTVVRIFHFQQAPVGQWWGNRLEIFFCK